MRGFLVAYPNGVDKHWSYARSGGAGAAVDDVRFVTALIQRLVATYQVDPARVYAAGLSDGGFFTQYLACSAPRQVAAIAPVAASLTRAMEVACSTAPPLPVVMFFGTDDPNVPWQGKDLRWGPWTLDHVVAAPDAARFWAAHDRCAPQPATAWLAPSSRGDPTSVRRDAYGACAAGRVLLYAIQGGGHTWPGGAQYLPASIVGATTRAIDARELMWDFFEAQR